MMSSNILFKVISLREQNDIVFERPSVSKNVSGLKGKRTNKQELADWATEKMRALVTEVIDEYKRTSEYRDIEDDMKEDVLKVMSDSLLRIF